MTGKHLRDVLLLSGLAAVAWGTWQWSPQLCWVIMGLTAIAAAVLWRIAERQVTNDPGNPPARKPPEQH